MNEPIEDLLETFAEHGQHLTELYGQLIIQLVSNCCFPLELEYVVFGQNDENDIL